MGYSYYRSITIDHTKCGSANSTDWPLLVSFTNTAFKTVANGGKVQNSNGYDIAFYSDSTLTTALYWEIEKYVATTGECIFWVKIPTLSASVDTVIYIAYGNPAISTFQSTASSVWNSNFKGVYHLPNGTTLTSLDSTTNANNAVNVGSPTAATGQIDGGVGTSAGNALRIPGRFSSPSVMTMYGWVNLTNKDTSGSYMLSIGSIINIYLYDGGTLDCFYNSTGGFRNLFYTYNAIGKGWIHVAYVCDPSNSTQKIYLNGSNVLSGTASQAISYSGASADSYIGRPASGPTGNYTIGSIDEARFATVGLSASWILSEYNNQNSPSTFFTLGAEVALATGNQFFMFM